MTYEKAFESDIGNHIIRNNLKLRSPKHSAIAVLFLIEDEKGTDSFWFPYIQSLPPKLDSLPISFDKNTLSLLKGSSFLQTIMKKKSYLEEDYTTLKNNIKDFDRFSFEKFKYFRFMISSRIFGFEINGKKSGGMIPFAGNIFII